MSVVKIKGLGPLKAKIGDEHEAELNGTEITAFEFIEKNYDVPPTESRMSFIINGRMRKGDYILQPNDDITVLKMGGAG